MNHSELPDRRKAPTNTCALDVGVDLECPLSAMSNKIHAPASESYRSFADAGCPLASDMHYRLQFETLLTELSAKFVNVPAGQVDSQRSSLRKAS
jgi:hypothetical protein